MRGITEENSKGNQHWDAVNEKLNAVLGYS